MADGHELKYSKEHGFFDRSLTVRSLIALFFGLSLFLFLHFREVRVEVLELGSVSPRYIVAEVNFAFPDDEATAILRQEALLDIGKIYAIDPDTIHKRKVEFENFLIYDQEWRKAAKLSTFDEMYKAMDKLSRVLQEVRFSDARTIQKLKEMGFKTTFYHELAPFDIRQGAFFPEKVWEFVKRISFDRQVFQTETINFIVDYLKNMIWQLKIDTSAEKKLQKVVRAEIATKYTEVAAGSRIIDRGDKVTPKHLAMLQSMKQALTEKRNLLAVRQIAASLMLTVLILVLSYVFLKNLHPDILASNKRLFLLVSIVVLGLVFAKVTEFLLLKTTENLFEIVRYPLLTPFVAILICSLVHPSVAIFVSAVLTVLLDSVLAFERHGFMMTNLLVAFFAILYTRSLRKRTEIFVVCGKAWLASCVLICALYFYDRSKMGVTLFADLGSSGAFMLATSVLVVGLLPVFESCFKILTDITLMEYMDPNHELLRRLTVEAPGTYQHALIMGNMAELAARSIGANGLFCRVATLYHDIGKMPIAQYFTENQQAGVNIHQLLTPVESAQVIISHVSEGVALARKAGLPEQFIDVIKEHHGTGLVYYFYHKQLESVGSKKELVNEKEFRYSGPKPKTKETVIIMIADCVEAASRSLSEVNEITLTKLVDQIVRERLDDGQFEDSILTFEELGKVKRALVKSLLSIGHFRVKYPARVRKDESAVEAGKA
ncbi:MAG: rane bound phosphohydrolase [Chlamydiia bacterium]|nr:rane bound phosphohydrolase [Chlamydiia bacterium]